MGSFVEKMAGWPVEPPRSTKSSGGIEERARDVAAHKINRTVGGVRRVGDVPLDEAFKVLRGLPEVIGKERVKELRCLGMGAVRRRNDKNGGKAEAEERKGEELFHVDVIRHPSRSWIAKEALDLSFFVSVTAASTPPIYGYHPLHMQQMRTGLQHDFTRITFRRCAFTSTATIAWRLSCSKATHWPSSNSPSASSARRGLKHGKLSLTSTGTDLPA